MYDFIQLLKDFSISYDTSVSNGWVNINCPLCGDNNLHGGLNLSMGYYNCFKCGGHTLEWVFSHLLGMSRKQTEVMLREYSGRLSIPDKLNKKVPQAELIELPGGDLGVRYRRYLRKRGFDPQHLVTKYGITGTGIAGEWAFRIIIPIFYNGKLVSFQGRDITDRAKDRYKTEKVEKSVKNPKSVLYNIDNATGEVAVVVEGAFDVWRIGDGCVATLGTTMTPAQVRLLLLRFRHVTFVFDSEEEAQQRALQQARQLASIGVMASILQLDDERDPAELNEEEVKQVRMEAGL